MKLHDALDPIQQLNDNAVIFARKPWTLEAYAHIEQLDADLRVPKEMIELGLQYFIEAPLAREVLEVFGAREPTTTERRALLMHYAENDTYPDLVYE